MHIVMTKELEPWWATDEEYGELTDAQVIELVLEDFTALIDGATWEIVREPSEKFTE